MRAMKRNQFLDFAKGRCIISVLVGHCIQYGSGTAFFEGKLYFENT